MDKNNSKTVEEYISYFPEEVQERMKLIRKTILSVAPEAEEMIRYKMASFKLRDKSYVYFAGFRNHISFYPFPSGDSELEQEAKGYNTSGRGTIQIQNTQEIPTKLIQKIVKYWINKETGTTLYNG